MDNWLDFYTFIDITLGIAMLTRLSMLMFRPATVVQAVH